MKVRCLRRCSLLPHKREPERTAVPGGHESPSGAFKPQTGLRSKCRVFSAARSQRFRRAYSRAEFVLFCRTKENQKGRRCPEGMKAPVGLLSRRPVCEANAACLARQGHGDFDALQPGGDCSLLAPKENQKSASDFDALDPRERGYSPLSTPKRMGSIQKS